MQYCRELVANRSLAYALYRCRLSFTLLRPSPSKGGCATTICTDPPSATFSNWHFYNQCLFNSFRQVIWLKCESKVRRFFAVWPHATRRTAVSMRLWMTKLPSKCHCGCFLGLCLIWVICVWVYAAAAVGD